jgi:hypothetical protein
MSMNGENPQDQSVPLPLPEREEERDVELFKRWLRGATFEALALQACVSVTQIYRIAKAKGWKKWEKRRYRLAAAEIDREANKKVTVRKFVEHRGKMGEWLETTLVFPKGAKAAPGIMLTNNPNCEVLEEDLEAGFIRQRTFFEGGWRSPFRSKRTEDEWL